MTAALACCSTFALLVAVPAAADTLHDALAQAYENNPTLTAARAGQRAVDENVPISRADGLPNVSGNLGYNEAFLQSSNSFYTPDRTVSAQVQLAVPIYQGGAVRNAVRAADARVSSGQAGLRGTESQVFSQVVGAYMDVLRDEAVVALNRNNVQVLTVNLQATRDRFDIGDLTRTDVAQSESRLAVSRGQLESAQARLIASREAYVRLVGVPPTNLSVPPPLPNMPSDVESAAEVAIAENPDLEAAQINTQAAGFDVRSAEGARLPHLSLTTTGGYSNYLNTLGSGIPGIAAQQTATTASAGVALTLPLFSGGRPAARVRQAQARQSQAIEQAIATERSIVAQVRGAFASWRAANAVIASSQTAVEASRLSLEGVRAENSVGTRTILDILNAEQELLNAQVQLVTARHDAYVAGFTLLAAMGRAEAKDLDIGTDTTRYDPDANYQRVRHRMWDWDRDPSPQPVSTPTSPTAPQNATIPDNDVPLLAR